MTAITMIFQIIGSIGFLLYGMKLMSDGIQKTAGESLHRILGFMTGNRFFAVLTGVFITVIIQSSSATTVMVVSFVNAGLLTLTQSIGVIFGANIGTTVTAWIVSLVGFKFKLALFAVPAFGIGYILYFIKKLRKEGLGEALMGFGLLFLGLEMLSNAMPSFNADNVAFLQVFVDRGLLGTLAGVIAGLVITVVLHSSSASTAIILTLSYNGLLTWEFAATMVLGSNIGTTIDAVLASIGTKVNARRAALVHVIFNVTGTIVALICLKPLLALVDFIIPGPVEESITIHVAMLHTVFNLLSTLIFLPFVTQLAKLTEKIIKPHQYETPTSYRLDFTVAGIKENAESYIIRAEKEISDMTDVVQNMFTYLMECTAIKEESFFTEEQLEKLSSLETYADQMQEGLSHFLVSCSQLALPQKTRNNVSLMLRVVDDLESMTDDCLSLAYLFRRSVDKKMTFNTGDIERLTPYMALVQRFLAFIKTNINKHLSKEELAVARDLEDQIDLFRKNLKKIARKRLEDGADVKTELLYIDIVRRIEKMGDHSFSISEALSQVK